MKITKLSLKRETLRELNGRELDAVAGGINAPPTLRSCLVTGCCRTHEFTCPNLTKPTMPC